MASHPGQSAKDIIGNFSEFTDVMRRLMAVPHAEVKAALEAEKVAKGKRKRAKASASRDSDAKA